MAVWYDTSMMLPSTISMTPSHYQTTMDDENTYDNEQLAKWSASVYSTPLQKHPNHWSGFSPVGGNNGYQMASSMMPPANYHNFYVDQQLNHGCPPVSYPEPSAIFREPGLGITTTEQECHPSMCTHDVSDFTPDQKTPMSINDYRHQERTTTPGWSQNKMSVSNSPMERAAVHGIKLQTAFEHMTADNSVEQRSNHTLKTEQLSSENSSRLQEPFQFRSNMSRQTSTSACNPGLTPSTLTTPMSGTSSFPTPASALSFWPNEPSNMVQSMSAVPTPIVSPQPRVQKLSPRAGRDYGRHRANTAQTYPLQRKPRIRPSLSDSNVTRMMSPQQRRRAVSSAIPIQHTDGYDNYATQGLAGQLPLPTCPPSMLLSTPTPNQYRTTTPSQSPYQAHLASAVEQPSANGTSLDAPSSPPPSDMMPSSGPYFIPVPQDPKFAGDLYTPRYKRRNNENRWEGWCGYCKPGRWLDLKNSRYWEDKYRNHGICARTRKKFADPEEIRIVDAETGAVDTSIDMHGNNGNSDVFVDLRITRRREGLCGKCKKWIPMDGMRTKARDRPVGWWVHAYACHEQGRQREGAEQMIDTCEA